MTKETQIKVPAELFAIAESSGFHGAYDLESLEIGPDDYRFEIPIEWQVEVSNTGSALLIAGSARAVASTSCARCLASMKVSLEGQIEGYYLIEDQIGDEFEGEDEPGADEFDVLPADHILDIAPLIQAALMVEAPNVPLCREDCKGLCPSCGANLNDGACTCDGPSDLEEFERAANPFSVLANLSFEDDEGNA